MNGKQARRLRKVARILGTKLNMKWTEYLVKNRTKRMIKMPAQIMTEVPVTQVRLTPNCGRKFYQHMKKDFNRQPHHIRAKLMETSAQEFQDNAP